MLNFEEVRAHVRAVLELKNDDPYLITVELKLSDGRRQGIYLAELEAENGRRYLRISSPIAPLAKSVVKANAWDCAACALAGASPAVAASERITSVEAAVERVDRFIDLSPSRGGRSELPHTEFAPAMGIRRNLGRAGR